VITPALPTPPAPAAKAPGGNGASASSESVESEFKHLMDAPADAPPRSEQPQADRAAPSDQPVADASAEAGDDATPADDPDATLPQQLLALIGWPPPAKPASTADSASPATAAIPSAATAGPAPVLPQTLTAIALDGVAANAPTMQAPQGNTAGLPGTATAATVDPALPGLAPTAATAMPVDADVAPADFARMFALAVDTDSSGTGETAGRAESGDGGLLLSPSPAPATTPRNPAAAINATPLTMPADPDAGFDDAFGARISWMAEQGIGRAELRLNPEHLGVIDIRLQIDGNRISAEFQSTSADVRHALENSVGRLRDMLGQQGMQLAHSDVGQGRDERQAGASGDVHRDDAAGPGPDRMDTADIRPVRVRGLLDEYA